MRLDKYLKVSRLIKRRSVASEACTQGRIMLNGKSAKPAAEVRAGDVLSLQFGERLLQVKVTETAEHALKADASNLYEVISQ